MATALKNLSDYKPDEVPDGKKMKIGIVVSEWNHEVTGALLEGAKECLSKHGVKTKNILIRHVPGSFELPLGAQLYFQNEKPDGVICLGCVIRGETSHFDYICSATSKGIMDVNLKFGKPCVFGVLTTETYEQAIDRAGGKHGNKGTEAAITVLKMIQLDKKA